VTKRQPHGKMCIVTINLPEKYLLYIKKLTEWGITPSRSEYIRSMAKEIIKKDFEFIKKVDEVIEADEIKVEKSVKIPEGYDYVEGFNGNKPFKTTRLEY